MAHAGPKPLGEANNQPQLLTLPRELRDQILLEALQNDGSILCYRKYDDDLNANDNDALARGCSREVTHSFCSLSLACKQFYRETVPIFFKNNTFELWVHGATPKIPEQHCRLIKSINVNIAFDIKANHIPPGFSRSFVTDHGVAQVQIRGTSASTEIDGRCWCLTTESVWKVAAYMPPHIREQRANFICPEATAWLDHSVQSSPDSKWHRSQDFENGTEEDGSGQLKVRRATMRRE